MIRLTFDDPRQTGSANALFARYRDIDTPVRQRHGDRSIFRHMNNPACAGDLHVEAAGSGRIRLGHRKILEVNLLVTPTALSRAVGDITDESTGSAHIEMRVGVRIRESQFEIEFLRGIAVIEMEMNVRAESGAVACGSPPWLCWPLYPSLLCPRAFWRSPE